MDQNQTALEATQPSDPATSHTRVDANIFAVQVLGFPGNRWTQVAVFAVMVLLAGAALRSSATVQPASAPGALVLLTTVACCYHQTYDAVLVLPVSLAVFAPTRGLWSDVPRLVQFVVALLCAVPLLNVTWTRTFRSLLERGLNISEGTLDQMAGIAAVVNSTACASAFILLALAIGFVRCRPSPPASIT